MSISTLVQIKSKRTIELDTSMKSSGIVLTPGMNICQTDLPIDWYQEEFKPYVEEYLALPDRTREHDRRPVWRFAAGAPDSAPFEAGKLR